MRLLTILILLAWSAAAYSADERTPAPLPADEATRTARVPDGFQVTLVAAEPDLEQPVGFCIDDRGRWFVAEALNYGEWQPIGRDRIVILEDTDGDGRAETRKLFYEGLNYVTGIEVGFGGVWVMSPPSLYFLPDRNQDDQIDGPPEVVFDGFGYRESRHNLANGFTWGPDGWLYAGHGRTSPSEVGRPGTPAEDRIHCDGGVYRIHPVRRVFENFADGTTNPWGVSFDDRGQCFVSNCVNPHLFHVIQGTHYEPWRNRPSSLYAYDRIATIADHLHYPTGREKGFRGETEESLAMGGGHAHCGTLVYLGGQFPEYFRNGVFMCNIHGRRVNHDRLEPAGSGFVARHAPDLMISRDPWFMGVTLQTGPDGSVYVSDWSDTGECHTYKPERETGRIYRISYGDVPRVAVNLAQCSDRELVEYQFHRNEWFVTHARRLLQERAATRRIGDEELASLRDVLAHDAQAGKRLRAAWALHSIDAWHRGDADVQLNDADPYVRGWAIQLLCEDPTEIADSDLARFERMAHTDPSPVVRLYLAAALQRLTQSQRLPIAAALVRHAEDADDHNLPLMLWYAMEPSVPGHSAECLRIAAASRIPRITEFTARRFVEYAVHSDGTDLRPLVLTLANASSASQQSLLAGVREGLKGRKVVPSPAGWSELYTQLLENQDPAFQQLATEVALTFGDPSASALLRRWAADASLPAERRIGALETMIEKGGGEELAEQLHRSLQDEVLRAAAIRGLAAVPQAATTTRLLELYPELPPEQKQDVVATLSSRVEFARSLLDAVEAGTVPYADLSAFAVRQMQALGDRELTSRLQRVWGTVRERQPKVEERIAKLRQLLTDEDLSGADRAQGRAIYQKTCQQCHVLFGEGAKIGPELTGSNRKNLEYLLSNLIDPSAEIGRDYRMSVVTTADGRVLTGIVLENSPARLTIQTATERVVLPSDEVDEVADSRVSMMPEGQLEQLTSEQIRDLIAYLQSAQQVSLPMTGSGS